MTREDGGRLVHGKAEVGMVVFTALSATAMTMDEWLGGDQGDEMMGAAMAWAEFWSKATPALKTHWVDTYEHLMEVADMIDRAEADEVEV